MANWNGLVMTDKGIALQSKVQAGEVLNITKLKLGSGTLPAETDIRKLTDLIKPEQNLGIGGREPNGDYCKISATISNVGLEAGYYVRELGVFAQDPDDGEILYAYTTDGAPDYLPAEGGSTVISQEFSVNIAVSDTDKINVEIDPGALATMGYIQLQVNEHNEDASAHEKAFSQHNTDETAHYDMTGATSSKAGKRGFAPAPKAGDQNKALFGNGQYQEVIVKTDIMVGATSSKGGTAGLVPAPDAGKHTSFLRGDGTWQNVPQPVIATQAEAEAGTDNTKHMTPLRVKQAIAKLSEGIPVGSILPFGGNSAPSGFLLCNGAAISRTTYANLYAVIGTTYGSGNGSSTFNVPNASTGRLINGSSLTVVGNGKALRFTDGSKDYGTYNDPYYTNHLGLHANYTNTNNGTAASRESAFNSTVVVGLSTTQSNAQVNMSSFPQIKYIIKY